ncbi:TKL protein kinase [Thecamonas trahens ATCC 50062]|uniref:TKL protein kinase n=1 Tax=Thecamonas trahens ATCC 50062 TaxID=461836 RepID=A0A0L0DMT1_THETB|nr:TKL protein kinase [Thecamonas trahens ATCC 50062]KNC53346.1 TKL protein kinase [Thecamonas trahens ATCC 50062]|eukprot:XP_013754394.1 TKL protein kinase [Thecamonas trahens ATCC 50062]
MRSGVDTSWSPSLSPLHGTDVVSTLLSLDATSSLPGIALPDNFDLVGALEVEVGNAPQMLQLRCPAPLDGAVCTETIVGVPVTASVLVPAANLAGLGNAITLSPELLIAMWSGEVTRWDSPLIAALNPGIILPRESIIVVAPPSGVADRVLGEIAYRQAGGALSIANATLAPTRTARRGVSEVEAAKTVASIPYALTFISSEEFFGGKHEGVLDVPRIATPRGSAVSLSEASVRIAVDTVGGPTISPLLSAVDDGWPLVYSEWALFPSSLRGVSERQCDAVSLAVIKVADLVSNLFYADRAWDYGHAVFPVEVRQSAVETLATITCNGNPALRREFIVSGSGSSLASTLYGNVMALYNALLDTNIQYVGLGVGADALLDGSSVFVGVDAPLDHRSKLASKSISTLVVPAFASSITLPYTIHYPPAAPPLPALVLSRSVVADIFLARITSWSDPAIAALNPVLAPWLPNSTICVCIYSQPNGMTSVFTEALAAFSPDWAYLYGSTSYMPPGQWPGETDATACILRADDATSVARAIAGSTSAIGFVTRSVAAASQLDMVSLINRAGNTVRAAAATVAAAADDSANDEPEVPHLPLVHSIVDRPAADAWPISTFTYFAIDGDAPADGRCAERRVFAEFLPLLDVCSPTAYPVLASCNSPAAPPPPAISTIGYVLIFVALAVVVVLTTAAVLLVRMRNRLVVSLDVDEDIVVAMDEVEIIGSLGTGSFGTVYTGRWRGTTVAVKHMHGLDDSSTLLVDFVSEASVLMKLRHPNIVLFMGIMLDPAALVTEYVIHGSLFSVLHDYDYNLETNCILWWAHAIAIGLDFLHQSGIIHRDMKSLNVLLDAGWVPKIADFGLASAKSHSGSSASRKAHRIFARKLKDLRAARPIATTATASGTIVRFDTSYGASGDRSDRLSGIQLDTVPSSGTRNSSGTHGSAGRSSGHNAASGRSIDTNLGSLLWAAPEILKDGASAASQASDVYSFAITAWEMLTRCEPYAGTNPVAVAMDVARGVLRPALCLVPEHASSIVPIIVAAWHQDPLERPSFAELATQLAACYARPAVVLPSKTTVPRGLVIAARVSCTLAKAKLLEDPDSVRELLLAFHTALATAAGLATVKIAESGVADVVLICQVAAQFACFAQRFLSDMSVYGGVCLVAAMGRLDFRPTTVDETSSQHFVFKGDVVRELNALASLQPVKHASTGVFISQTLVPELQGALDANPNALLHLTEADAVADSDIEPIGVATLSLSTNSMHRSSSNSALGLSSELAAGVSASASRPRARRRTAGHRLTIDSSSSRRPADASFDGLRSSLPAVLDKPGFARAHSADLPPPLLASSVVGPDRLFRAAQSDVNALPSTVPSSSAWFDISIPTSEFAAVSASIEGTSNLNPVINRAAFSPEHSPRTAHTSSGRIELCAESTTFLLSAYSMKAIVQSGKLVHVSSHSKAYVSTYLHKPVLVKLLLDQDVKPTSLVTFVTALAKLLWIARQAERGSVVPPIAACSFAPYIGVVMPYAPLGSLADLASPKLSVERSAVFLRNASIALADALAGLHQLGGVHGSLKPANVLVAHPTGSNVALADACIATIRSSLSTMTLTPTIAYQSPEELSGEPPTAASDLASHIRTVNTPDLADFPARLIRIFHSCWKALPADRTDMTHIARVLWTSEVEEYQQFV